MKWEKFLESARVSANYREGYWPTELKRFFLLIKTMTIIQLKGFQNIFIWNRMKYYSDRTHRCIKLPSNSRIASEASLPLPFRWKFENIAQGIKNKINEEFLERIQKLMFEKFYEHVELWQKLTDSIILLMSQNNNWRFVIIVLRRY